MRLVLAIAAAALSTGAFAQSDKDHAAHHPPGASAPAATTQKAHAAAASKKPTPTQVDAQLKAMHEMHEKMAAAKTPEERQALMAEHMKAMQDGMAMMREMHEDGGSRSGGGMDGGMSMGSKTMEKRMDMMEEMMQMMMDHEPAPVAAK